ncbi:putative peptidyl prolyl cis-trans isomerase cyclophilin [Pyronema domesticum]|uniref:Similar to Peptidyl-prolyl cis-trans isomerase E acc. no. A4FV72 n=1 Tax=Pyronema omphalodes (strain CBS 100304) TaxID=1076935 RepID=U4LKP3_PYROM|nr:putative peptidyl prolyl cis-trans isomerase cyclophilin [Pyronema domesticum]CCX32147.1 Similar to Peptidyl-prolyl cis-trans isomerase E; acc. no. A4FV72 [Pyronema omphalodes CBS 100304]
MSDATRLKCTVYVGGLDKTVTKPVLQQAFLPFGEVVEVNIPTATDEQHQHRGFGYVEFENQEDAAAAIDNMDQAMLAGRFVTVAQAKPQKDVGNVLGSKVAVWEQEEWIRKYEVSEEDRAAADQAKADAMVKAVDPMQGLEGLDVAGPKPASE